jgi:nucleoside-diphosphate-sugar epimerase
MTAFSKLAPVMVSGANGFLGLHLVNVLLKNGYTVHATVRDATDVGKTGAVQALQKGLPGTLKLFSSNLLQEGSFHEAMDGCSVVYHTASPFLISGVTNPLQQVLEPAIKGTENVLKAVNDTGSVQRVVQTSSVAATRFGNQEPKNGDAFTEEDWNESTVDETSDARQVYSFSKAEAERLAWDYVKAQNRWDLVVINPALVLGPTLSSSVTSESFAILKACLLGNASNGALNVVDVRDVALAHFNAGTMPEASGRHLLCEDVVETKAICDLIQEKFPGKYPECDFGKNDPVAMFKIDNTRSIERLGINYRSLGDTIADTVKSYEEVVGFEMV